MITLPSLLATLLACGGGDAVPDAVSARVVQTAMGRLMAQDLTASLDDGLHLGLCGAGGPMPAPNASGPCVVVTAGQRIFVVDAGTDGARNLVRMGYPIGRVEAVLLTHFHSDHVDGLGELGTLRWVSLANTTPLPVHGPTGVSAVVEGFNQVYAHDEGYRQAHHGDVVAPVSGSGMVAHPFEAPPAGQLHPVLADGDLTIEALRVDHHPVHPAVGYRFTYKDRSLLITGDTSKSDEVRRFAEGVDLLVHDALADNLVGMMHDIAVEQGDEVLAKVTADIPDYHATPRQAAETARDAGVQHLLYYHVTPPIVADLQRPLFLNGADEVFAHATIGQDGVAFSLPAGSTDVRLTSDGL